MFRVVDLGDVDELGEERRLRSAPPELLGETVVESGVVELADVQFGGGLLLVLKKTDSLALPVNLRRIDWVEGGGEGEFFAVLVAQTLSGLHPPLLFQCFLLEELLRCLLHLRQEVRHLCFVR